MEMPETEGDKESDESRTLDVLIGCLKDSNGERAAEIFAAAVSLKEARGKDRDHTLAALAGDWDVAQKEKDPVTGRWPGRKKAVAICRQTSLQLFSMRMRQLKHRVLQLVLVSSEPRGATMRGKPMRRLCRCRMKVDRLMF